MPEDIYWIYVVSVDEGALDRFKDLIGELVEASRNEAGTIAYQFSTGDAGRTVHIFEHYADSAAVVSHVQHTFTPRADRFKSMARTTSVMVYGKPDAAARELMDPWGAIYMTPIDGFIRS